jgi:phage tail sheath protein FI
MAETIISPGVFTEERDLSFLPQGIAGIGAAVVGPTEKGPAFTPTTVTSISEFNKIFGDNTEDKNEYFVPITARQYFAGGATSLTVVRTLHLDGYHYGAGEAILIYASGSGGNTDAGEAGYALLAVLAPAEGTHTATNASWITSTAYSASAFDLNMSNGSFSQVDVGMSFDSSSGVYLDKVLPTDSKATTRSGGTSALYYVYSHFRKSSDFRSKIATAAGTRAVYAITGSLNFTSGSTSFGNTGQASAWTGNKEASTARTPYIQSQLTDSSRYNLFRCYTKSAGTRANKICWVEINNIIPPADVPGSDYGTFTIQVNKYAPGKDKAVLETHPDCSMDPSATNFFARQIGDKFITTDSNGDITEYGDYPNKSEYIRVGDFDDIKNNVVPASQVPMGHAAVNLPVQPPNVSGNTYAPGSTTLYSNVNSVVTASMTTTQIDKKTSQLSMNPEPYGFDFDDLDNANFCAPIPSNAAGTTLSTGIQVSMSLEDMSGSADTGTKFSTSTYANATTEITLTNSHKSQRKFKVPFQWGFDGNNPHTAINTGLNISATNTQGFAINSTSAAGYTSYKRAIDTIKESERVDFNLLLMPGVNHSQHSSITNYAISAIEDRADAFFVLDPSAYGDSISTTKTTVKPLDTNYAGVYYPWVKVVGNTGRQTWVPPSVVIAHAIANNDAVASEWFAPAGLNRGGLSMVSGAEKKLRGPERDDLYDARINPIAHFTGQGFSVFGQKTLQGLPSALDRINVRRLLITVKKFIASASRFLVFEQNDVQTRNRFMNIVNPYLESIQQARGLTSFRVVMDDSNNTPDVIDRNRLVGQILLQPTRTAEFIVLDFVVLPTGAAFPE